jgi:hypothetical protein
VRRRLESRGNHKDDSGQTSNPSTNSAQSAEEQSPSTDLFDGNLERVTSGRLGRADHKDVVQDTVTHSSVDFFSHFSVIFLVVWQRNLEFVHLRELVTTCCPLGHVVHDVPFL